MVDGRVALRWLEARRGFVPTPASPKDDAFLAERIADATSVEELVTVVRRYGGILFGGAERCLLELGAASWEEVAGGIASMDMARVQAIGERLDLDVPTFVGKAAEVAVRDRLSGSRP